MIDQVDRERAQAKPHHVAVAAGSVEQQPERIATERLQMAEQGVAWGARSANS
jgi:hypothetical protein